MKEELNREQKEAVGCTEDTIRLIESVEGPACKAEMGGYREGDRVVYLSVFGDGVVLRTEEFADLVVIGFEGYDTRRLRPESLVFL